MFKEPYAICSSATADRRDRAGSAADPLRRRTDAVMVLLISENGTVLWRVLNFDCSAVKHALQNTRNDCKLSWLNLNLRIHEYHHRQWLQTMSGQFQEISLRKEQMAMEGKTSKKEGCKRKVENAPWEMSTSGPGSEPDDGEELGDDDAPDW